MNEFEELSKKYNQISIELGVCQAKRIKLEVENKELLTLIHTQKTLNRDLQHKVEELEDELERLEEVLEEYEESRATMEGRSDAYE